MKRFRDTQIAVAWAVALLMGATSHGQCRYEITESILSGSDIFIGLAMNDHGEVVGYRFAIPFGNDHAAYWSPSTGVVTLTLPGAFNSQATDINNDGAIVGWQDTRENDEVIGKRAFIIDGGVYTRIDPPVAAFMSEAMGVSETGRVVGNWDPDVGPLQGFYWEDGVFTDLGPILEGPSSRAYGTNKESDLCGLLGDSFFDGRVYVYLVDGVAIAGDVIPGGISSEGDAINNRHHVGGRGLVSFDDALWRAILWDGKTVTDLGTLPVTTRSIARDINDSDQIVGYCHNEFQADITPFLWQDGVMHNLRDLLVGGGNLELDIPYAILNDGRILCTANTTDGQAGGTVILSPVNSRPADINNDCIVDRLDLILLLDQWNTTDSFADIDGNDIVNVFDLLDLLQQWG